MPERLTSPLQGRRSRETRAAEVRRLRDRKRPLGFDEIAERMGLHVSTVRDYYRDPDGSQAKARRRPTPSRTRKERTQPSKDALARVLRRFYRQEGRTPVASDFRPSQAPAHRRPTIIEREPGKWATLDAFLTVFGSFAAAIRYAGLEPARPGRAGEWPPERIYEAIRRDTARRGRATVSTDWRHAVPGEHPSVSTVVRNCGSFRRARAAALGESPSRQPEEPYAKLADLKPWLLLRGHDFEPDIGIETVRQRVRSWAERNQFSRARGYLVTTRVVTEDPETGRSYSELAQAPPRDATTKPEYALAVQIDRDPAEAKRRLRRNQR